MEKILDQINVIRHRAEQLWKDGRKRSLPIWIMAGILLLVGSLAGVNLLRGVQEQESVYRDPATSQVNFHNLRTNMTSVVRAEVAADAAKQQQGLMFRRQIPQNTGMLFVFADEIALEFWMLNTYVPLDIIFMDASGQVVSIHKYTKVLQTSETYPSKSPAKYALEVAGGWADQNGLLVGDKLELDY